MSGWRDSNPRPPAPKAGALTGLRYTPSFPALKPVIGLTSAPQGFSCQSRTLPAGGTVTIPGCKDSGFFLSGKLLSQNRFCRQFVKSPQRAVPDTTPVTVPATTPITIARRSQVICRRKQSCIGRTARFRSPFYRNIHADAGWNRRRPDCRTGRVPYLRLCSRRLRLHDCRSRGCHRSSDYHRFFRRNACA